ncbi:tetratricopeptide repeat protein [Planctomycetota bacterium]
MRRDGIVLTGDRYPKPSGLTESIVLDRLQNRHDDTETWLLTVLKGRRIKLGDTHPHTLESFNNLIELYEASSKPEKAEEWRAKLPQT